MLQKMLAVGVAVGALTACTSLRVKSDVNPNLAGTVQCHTFAWAGSFRSNSPLRSTIANPLNESRLREAITTNLQAKGMQPVAATSGPECLVGYGIGAQNVVDSPYGGWGPGWGWGWYDYPYVYSEGIVAVDLYDAKTRQPIWHASVDQNLIGASGPQAQKKIEAAVAALFTKYPGNVPVTKS